MINSEKISRAWEARSKVASSRRGDGAVRVRHVRMRFVALRIGAHCDGLFGVRCGGVAFHVVSVPVSVNCLRCGL